MKKLRTVDLCCIAVGAALIAVCSWISIPFTVPFTLQTFAVFFCLSLLGGKRGFLSILVFILLGMVGVPVFSGFRAGIGVLLGTTGGYIVGFLLTGLIYWLAESLFGERRIPLITSLLIGLAVCYAFGTVWFMVVYARSAGAVALGTALGWCVIPFILPDLGKMALALLLAVRLKKHLPFLKAAVRA